MRLRDQVGRGTLATVEGLLGYMRGLGELGSRWRAQCGWPPVPGLAGAELRMLQFIHPKAREFEQTGTFALAPFDLRKPLLENSRLFV